MLQPNNQAAHEAGEEIVKAGGIIAFRTDTFYALGADPFNREAIQKIRALKGREEDKPILILISDTAVVDRFVRSRSKLFDEIALRHWPGPLTLVGSARMELPDNLTAGSGTIGVRLPDDADVRRLVRACGGALTGTSANLSGSLPARSVEEVQTYFPVGIDLIIDAGYAMIENPSTVLDLSTDEPRIIREGAISREALATLLAGRETR